MPQSFGGMSPKASFFTGVGSVIGVLSFIGLLIMAFTFAFANDESSNTENVGSGNNAQAQPSVNAPSMDQGHGGGVAEVSVAAITDDDHIRGNPSAKISIVEFSDFECPFCARLHPTLNQVISEYDGDVNWVYRHFPLSSIHRNAESAAEASECASEQGKFWEFADELFNRQASLGSSAYSQIATSIGLNVSQFESCINNGTYGSEVAADLQDATNAGGRGTPYAVIVTDSGDTIPISGAQPFAQFQSIISGLL